MKVLLISSSSGSHGGGEFYLNFLADGLVGLGCEVVALMSDGQHMNGLAEMMAGNCQVQRIPLTNTYHRKTRAIGSVLDWPQIRRIRQAIDEVAPDVVHLNKQCVDDGLGIVRAAKSAKVPAIATIHVTRSMSSLNASMGRIRDWVSRRVMQQAHLPIITVSKQSQSDWLLLDPQANVSVVPNGTSPTSTVQRCQIRQAWGVLDNQIALGTVARIEAQKNPMFLPRVIAELPGHVHMYWVGDGRLRDQLEAEIKRCGVEQRFHLLGWQDNAKDLLCGMDVFVLPSLYEGFPFAILEAMSAGLPCVVSDVDGNSESVANEKTGFVLPVNDHQGWVGRLLQLIEQPELRQSLGRAAERRFTAEYDVSVMAKRTIEVYQTAINDFAQPTARAEK